MQQSIEKNPESTYLNKAWFELGNARFTRDQYAQMLQAYQKQEINLLLGLSYSF